MALCAALPLAARTHPGPWTNLFERALAILLLGMFVAYPVVVASSGDYDLDFDLPLHLTDSVTVVAALALWTRRPLLFELTYFWGLTASLQAVLTPALDVEQGFPSFLYLNYFVTHSGVVLAAVYLAFGIGLTPRAGAVGRVFVVTAAWACVAAAGNVLTGGNYMFLREKPGTASLLDYMGPWPWYIIAAAALALGSFWLLDQAFRRRRRAAGRAGP